MSHFGNISTWPSSNSCEFCHAWPHLVLVMCVILFLVMLSLLFCICASCHVAFILIMCMLWSHTYYVVACSMHKSCIITNSPSFPFFHFASAPFTFSLNVHILPINLAPCHLPLCQISPYLKLFWSGSRMTQVWTCFIFLPLKMPNAIYSHSG